MPATLLYHPTSLHTTLSRRCVGAVSDLCLQKTDQILPVLPRQEPRFRPFKVDAGDLFNALPKILDRRLQI